MAKHASAKTGAERENNDLPSRLLAHLKRDGYIRAGERIAVAVSGGADSVALLLLLLELREKLGIVLSVVHFNHQLRGRASDGDQKFVASLAARHSLEFHVQSGDVAARAKNGKINLEDAGRRARYAFFRSLIASRALHCVATAHTADDQAETVLAHIFRGTGLAGLGGIHPQSDGILRPLLAFHRADLRAYLRSRKQKWREDSTNRDTARTRARIRGKLIPLLERQFQPAIIEHLCALANLAREDDAYLESAAQLRVCALAKEEGGEIRISASDLVAPRGLLPSSKALPTSGYADVVKPSEALARRVVRQIVRSLKPRPGELGAVHVQSIIELAQTGENGKSLALPGGVEVLRDRDVLIFRASTAAKGKTPLAFEHRLDSLSCSAAIPVSQLRCVIRLRVIDWPTERRDTNLTGAVLDRDRLAFPLVLRSWRPGDRLHPAGRATGHKLTRFFSEKRIGKWERAGWPVLTSGGILAWARGFPVAAEFAADERTQAGIVIVEEPIP
ncbi:MAG TPA: tRNA lysidine(34) synthetase TilS [Candidatus Dormibacteraeota bacterium]|nr:tRNA lysidine(34) synthetase TilS [Candidatus Dormibacteraeota bacterium]